MLFKLFTEQGHPVAGLKKSKKFGLGDAPEWVDDKVEDMIGVGQGSALAFMDNDFVAVESCGDELVPQLFGFFRIGRGDDYS